jgi:hypothetical protein
MPDEIAVEINLRLPNITIRSANEPVRVIVNADVRFTKRIDVAVLPRTGDRLELSTRGGCRVPVTIKRVDWHDDKEMFVVGCQYAERSLPPAVYDSLNADPDWHTKPLL